MVSDGTLNADACPRAGFDPVLISLIRRSMPNLIAYDICGVQPMSGPTGMIFAMRAMYDGPDGPNEAFFDEADPTFSSGANNFDKRGGASGTKYDGYQTDANGKFIPAMAGANPGDPLQPWDGDPENKVVGYLPTDSTVAGY